MNKKILAVSVAAALSFGAGVANAQAVGETGAALVVPYYTVQNGNATLINIVNTDTMNGKAVKVRFRGAEHSDDVFDFQVFLSPADVWTANVSQAADGRAQLTTNDASCTLPSNVNQPFVTARLSGTDAEKAASTREGYVEIINMGDIVTSSATVAPGTLQQQLYTATKHVNGVAPCTESVLSTIKTSSANASGVNGDAQRLSGATGGLMANTTIINVADASAWAVEAVAVVPDGTYNVAFWSQTNSLFTGNVEDFTLDGIFLSGAVTPAQFDFPDLSTPRTAITPFAQYTAVNSQIGLYADLSNEFITDDSIFADTDWVVSLPTRRYAIEGRIAPSAAADTTVAPNGEITASTTSSRVGEFVYLAPFASLYNAASNCLSVNGFTIYDREETTTTTGVVISPGELTTLTLCGEVAVVSFNNAGATTSGALGGELTLNDAVLPFVDGWATISFDLGLPAIASSFVQANNGGTGAANMNFGGQWRHRGALLN